MERRLLRLIEGITFKSYFQQFKIIATQPLKEGLSVRDIKERLCIANQTSSDADGQIDMKAQLDDK